MKKSEMAKRYGVTVQTLRTMLADIPELKECKRRKLMPIDIALIEAKYGKMPKIKE
jgi:hypothetical protein